MTHGAKRTTISARLSDGANQYLVERVIRPNEQTALKVIKNDGEKVSKPETFVKDLINQLSFSPRPFMDASDEKKLTFLMELLGIDFTGEDADIEDTYGKRRDLNRLIKNMGTLTVVEPSEMVDTQEILVQKQAIKKRNEEARKKHDSEKEVQIAWEHKRAQTKKRLTELNSEKTTIEDQIKELKESLTACLFNIEKGEVYQKNLPDAVVIPDLVLESVDELDNQLANAATLNQKANDYLRYTKDLKDKQEKQSLSESYTEQLKEFKLEKQKKLSETKIPVSGLTIILDDEDRPDGVYFKGIHSNNWSESESITISSELCLAMQPNLRAVFIDKGEAYDSDSLKALDAWATKHNLQAIITIVEDIPEELEEGVFYIEEGTLITKGIPNAE